MSVWIITLAEDLDMIEVFREVDAAKHRYEILLAQGFTPRLRVVATMD